MGILAQQIHELSEMIVGFLLTPDNSFQHGGFIGQFLCSRSYLKAGGGIAVIDEEPGVGKIMILCVLSKDSSLERDLSRIILAHKNNFDHFP